MKKIINHNHNLDVEKEFEQDPGQFINLDRNDLDTLVRGCGEVHSFVADSAGGITPAVDDMLKSIEKSGIWQNVKKVILQISASKDFDGVCASELDRAVKLLTGDDMDFKWGVRSSASDCVGVRLLLVAGW